MIVFPFILVGHAEEAGIKIPEDLDKYDPEKFPHWHVFCQVQLGRRIPKGYTFAVSENAKLIAKIPKAKLKTLTLQNLVDMGLR